MLLMAGCGTTVPVDEIPVDSVDVTSDAQVIEMDTSFQFVFPGTGWYMDFEYVDGFIVDEREGNIVFETFDGDTIEFQYDHPTPKLEGAELGGMNTGDVEEFVGNGWWGKQTLVAHGEALMIAFTTPDSKYHVTVTGEPDVLENFVTGMTMGK